ncbi:MULTISPECIES: VOC family protein [Pandoraea]|uniref:Iron-dependent extradiol dioxygenase n=2 Tax=Pandoraea TaxID=93217 RepID=A0A239SA88_9BURK|nr:MULTISPECIES: VOC family protein [Pandoraea]AJC15952.1 bleomycin resistance protein [Pandoraea sputorum]AKC69407.1 bleomycin resistance protein [Pandoraea oxalativorans]SNU81808.1 Iron-dependent extradiol dioxygenase [Pandoraea sputorum]VVD63028.1 Iron-dependent extradiol dioxygenase [Pandoraea sputorum]VVE81707.1 Iron-dependent extradiol dioxygenase [Pandoraea sputorum]
MINLHDIRYVRLGTRDLEGATRYARTILGLQEVRREAGFVFLRSDSRDHSVCYFEGDPADHTVAFDVASDAHFDAAAAQLDAMHIEFRRGTRDEADLRRVADFLTFRDPTGNQIELVLRAAQTGRGYHGERDAGIDSFSHVGLCTTDARRDEAFWTSVCNARVSDRIGDAPLLRIDDVHHKIALFPAKRAGIQHVNFQVNGIDDLMRSWYFLREQGVPIRFGPGRHPTSHAMFLYFAGPDGMVYEYSTGVRKIAPEDEATYVPRQFPFDPTGFCMWGAKPEIPEFSS